MAAPDNVIRMPLQTKLVCSACGAPGQGSCRCGAPYVTPGERAEAAVKASPEKSDRAIAEQIKVHHSTVNAARKRTVGNPTVGKRTGKDGKTRKMPRKARSKGNTTAQDKARTAVRTAIVTDDPTPTKTMAAQLGVSDDTIERLAAAERARIELLDELGINPTTLSMTAQQKLAAAQRQMQYRLETHYAQLFQQQISNHVKKLKADLLPNWEKDARHAHIMAERYEQMVNKHKPIFTPEQFRELAAALHPDRGLSNKRQHEAFTLFTGKKMQLTGQQ